MKHTWKPYSSITDGDGVRLFMEVSQDDTILVYLVPDHGVRQRILLAVRTPAGKILTLQSFKKK